MGNTITIDGNPVAINTGRAFQALAADFNQRTGLTLHVTDGLRTYAQQQALYKAYLNGTGNLAANPDNVVAARHISGHAVDVHDSGKDSGVTVIGSKRHTLLKSILAAHGFTNTGDGFSPPEGWHIDFGGDPYGAATAGGKTQVQITKDRQNWLNDHRGEKLVVDGEQGDATTAAYKRYETFLKQKWGYTGQIDGQWGPLLQTAHQKFVDSTHKTAAPSASAHTGKVSDLASLGDVTGLQKIAKLYGYTGKVDNIWGAGSQAGLQKFLSGNYGNSLAKWLRAKWGYKDSDDLWGPNMKAAATRANTANKAAL